jgi:hypothetical protein
MVVRRLLILMLVALASLSPAMTLAAYPHCALQGAECGSPCASSPTVMTPAPIVVRIASISSMLDGPAAVIPPAPIRLSDLPPRPVSSAQ